MGYSGEEEGSNLQTSKYCRYSQLLPEYIVNRKPTRVLAFVIHRKLRTRESATLSKHERHGSADARKPAFRTRVTCSQRTYIYSEKGSFCNSLCNATEFAIFNCVMRVTLQPLCLESVGGCTFHDVGGSLSSEGKSLLSSQILKAIRCSSLMNWCRHLNQFIMRISEVGRCLPPVFENIMHNDTSVWVAKFCQFLILLQRNVLILLQRNITNTRNNRPKLMK